MYILKIKVNHWCDYICPHFRNIVFVLSSKVKLLLVLYLTSNTWYTHYLSITQLSNNWLQVPPNTLPPTSAVTLYQLSSATKSGFPEWFCNKRIWTVLQCPEIPDALILLWCGENGHLFQVSRLWYPSPPLLPSTPTSQPTLECL